MKDIDKKSRSYRLKKGLLRKAWDGQSKLNGSEMIAKIMEFSKRGREMPVDHVLALHEIDDEEPRAVRALNLLEEEKGTNVRHTAKLDNMDSPSPLFH